MLIQGLSQALNQGIGTFRDVLFQDFVVPGVAQSNHRSPHGGPICQRTLL